MKSFGEILKKANNQEDNDVDADEEETKLDIVYSIKMNKYIDLKPIIDGQGFGLGSKRSP